MSTRHNNGSHYENHQRAAELQKGPAHAHRVGEQHGKQDHLTAHEQTRQADEYAGNAHRNSPLSEAGQGTPAFGHSEIEALAFDLWQARGCPQDSPEVDWFQAVKQLRSRALAH
jgi:hypothetical protein